MSIVFTVKPANLGRVNVERAREFPRAVKRAMERATDYMVRSLKMRTVYEDKIDLGGLYRGWRGRVTAYSRGFQATYSNVARHHYNVERGRRPGRMPPVARIAAWAGRKLGRPDLGWPIARAIARRGIGPTPILTSESFRRRAREVTRREVLRDVRAATNRAIRRARG